MLASILFFFIGFISLAQDISVTQDGTPPPPMGPTPPGFPIDDSVMILFFVALVYGIYKTRSLTKEVN